VGEVVAIKRLSAVEVDPASSHQREFHADRLGRELGIDGDRAEGALTASYYPAAGDAVVESSRYTYYQARKPPRSEFRLYPRTSLFLTEAHAGDLMLVFRSPADSEMHLVVAERGSRAEAEILEAFFARDVPSLDRFRYVDSVGRSDAEQLGLALVAEPRSVSDVVTRHPTYLHAVGGGTYPSTTVMALSGREIADEAFGTELAPDEFLFLGLEAETQLYFAIESVLASRELAQLTAAGADLTTVLAWSTARLNARKARRGRSLQRHIEALLEREGIPFSPECSTEAPPPVDVMVPGCSQYNDPAFSVDRLRAISCKSTLKERWQEIVGEARRVPVKYVVTLDEQLTDPVIEALQRAHVRPFMPARVLAGYDRRATRELLSSISELVADLRSAVA
jgi:hypothetical protein